LSPEIPECRFPSGRMDQVPVPITPFPPFPQQYRLPIPAEETGINHTCSYGGRKQIRFAVVHHPVDEDDDFDHFQASRIDPSDPV